MGRGAAAHRRRRAGLDPDPDSNLWPAACCSSGRIVGPDTPQRLWLYALGISNNCFNCVLHGTTEGTSYDIRSTTSLHATNNWAIETNFPGASGQFWTPVSIPLSGRPSLFLSARSWVDSTGSGIPDWWLLQYFGRTDIDPYALCPSGDGWTHPPSLQNGWNPTNFYTPPTPVVSVIPLPNDNGVIISWQPAPGAVTGYSIFRNGVGPNEPATKPVLV